MYWLIVYDRCSAPTIQVCISVSVGGEEEEKEKNIHIATRNEEKCSLLHRYAVCYVKTSYGQ